MPLSDLGQSLLDKGYKPCTSLGFQAHYVESLQVGESDNSLSQYSFY